MTTHMTIPRSASIETLCIHAGQEPDPATGAVMTPIVLATTFAQEGPLSPKRYDYSRAGNPTRTALEACLASLEGADARRRLRERVRGGDGGPSHAQERRPCPRER